MTGKQAQTKPTPASMAVQVSGSAVVQLVSVPLPRALGTMSTFVSAQARDLLTLRYSICGPSPLHKLCFADQINSRKPVQDTHKAPTKKIPIRPPFRFKGICEFHNTNIGSINNAKSAKVLKTLVEVSDALVPTLHAPDMGVGDKRSQK